LSSADREAKAITLGHPSYVWRYGQDRRLAMIEQYAPLEGQRILDTGCGVGMYVRAFRQFSEQVYGIDVDPDKIAEASRELPHLQVAPAESLPFEDGFFDVVLSHEVWEHVKDDRAAAREAVRVLRPGGRLVVFVPNRLWFFETHGAYWRGVYHFGNIPLVNWLPDALRNKLAPHVRAYTGRQLRALFEGLPVRVVVHTQVFPGYDKIVARRPAVGRILRALTYAAERTPLRIFGLSHLLVVEKTPLAEQAW
jgi:SAM-dependent methyltransferase